MLMAEGRLIVLAHPLVHSLQVVHVRRQEVVIRDLVVVLRDDAGKRPIALVQVRVRIEGEV